MIRAIRAMVAIPVLALVGACGPQSTPPTVDLAAEAQAVRNASAQWVKAVQDKDWAAAAAYYAPDGMSFPDHQEPLVGPAAIQAASEAMAAGMNGTVSWTPDKVVVASAGDMALEIGSWTWASEVEPDSGRYVVAWQKIDGQWKALADIGVSTNPLPEEK